MPHKLAAVANPYGWWRNRKVDYRVDDGSWLPGVVTDARRLGVGLLQDGNRANDVIGEVDGFVTATLRNGVTVRGEIYPGGPHGIIPRVVLAAPFETTVEAWWDKLSPACQAELIANPDGAVPAEWLSEVTADGPAVAGAFWVSVQSGPDGFHLGRQHHDLVVDRGLRGTFVRAQADLDRAVDESVGVEAFTPAQIRIRDRAKIAWDDWRGELGERDAYTPMGRAMP